MARVPRLIQTGGGGSRGRREGRREETGGGEGKRRMEEEKRGGGGSRKKDIEGRRKVKGGRGREEERGGRHASGEEGAAELGTGSGGKWMGAFFNQVSCLARCTHSVVMRMADARLWRAIARSNRKYLYWEIKSHCHEVLMHVFLELSREG